MKRKCLYLRPRILGTFFDLKILPGEDVTRYLGQHSAYRHRIGISALYQLPQGNRFS